MEPRINGNGRALCGRRGRRAVATALTLAGLGACLGAGVVRAEVDKEAAARGRVTYRIYCMNCHGPLAKGDGKLAPILKVKIADLTQITAKNGGTFPEEKMHEVVDGRKEVAAHGLREMPIWGDAFQTPEQGGDQEAKAKAKIRDLIEFLKSIQAAKK